MKYWAFEIKEGKDILINCKDIESVCLLGEHTKYDIYSGLAIEGTSQDNVSLLKTAVNQSKNTKKKVSKKKRTKKNAVPVRPEIRAGGRTRQVHVPVSAEQRFANKLARETATGRTVEVIDKDLVGVKFTVSRHVDGSLFLLQEEGTKNEYWAKWKMKDDLWIIWNDNYGEETDDHHNTGNEHAEGPHRSSCCYTVNRRRLANVPYCLACKDDSPTQRTNRRIANGGPEANLIFNEDGQLTTAWTQKAKEIYLNRIREQEENE